MPSSISSSSRHPPKGAWLIVWLAIVIGTFTVITYFELSLRSKGWVPSLADSNRLWSLQREKASELGEEALVFIGASRSQLGIDLAMVRANSSFYPIQLSIDGSSFMPVLKNLAEDKKIKGTIVVSLSMSHIKPEIKNDRATQWVSYYNRYYLNNKFIEPYKIINNRIKAYLENNLALKFEGAKPSTVIVTRAFDKTLGGNYLVTNRNRSRDADYSKVEMPDFYIRRLKRNFGRKLIDDNKLSSEQILETYSHAIDKLKPKRSKEFINGLNILLGYIKTIESRGGKVILVRFPTDKLIWKIDQKKFPRKIFFDELAKRHDKTIHFSDYPELSNFDLPDGSHLDFRDKKQFTKSLVDLILKKY